MLPGVMALLEQVMPLVLLLSPWLLLFSLIGMQLARQLASVPAGSLPSHLVGQRLLQELLINPPREKPLWNIVFA